MAKQKPTTKEKEQNPPKEVKPAEMRLELLSIDLLDDPEQPMRSEMTPASVEDLVMSIKQVGVIEPIVVKPVKGRFEVIAGHRRLYACKLAKVPQVPCYVRQANSEQTEMLKIHENLYRAEILPADEAKHFAYLVDKQGLTPPKISQLISKSLSYVHDRLAILSWPDFLRDAMQNREITFSVAREFSRFDDLKQMSSAVYYAKRGGMTQEMAAKWVKDHKRSKERQELQNEPPDYGDGQNQPVEHTANCIFCKQGLRLIEAEVVYMHNSCAQEASKLEPVANPTS